MDMKKELKVFALLAGIFVFAYFIPLGNGKVANAILESFRLLQWYVREHTLGCVVPAMFIAGAISTFLSQQSVVRYLGPKSDRVLAYSVASVAGIILAVCSCSVLPMFAGIYAMGAGLGPASAFLYSGPAINVMAVFLSAHVLGLDIGLARVIGSVGFAFIIGLLMAFIFRKSENERLKNELQLPEIESGIPHRPLWKTSLFFLCMILLLIFSDWYNTNDVNVTMNDGREFRANVRYKTNDVYDMQMYESENRLKSEVIRINKSDITSISPVPSAVMTIHGMKWYLAAVMGIFVLIMTFKWHTKDELIDWMTSTWSFAKTIIPLLFGGVFITGFVGALIPESYVASLVGGNSFISNFNASFFGMIWYFATLTEIPIVETLMRLGMGKGPALALLLAGPALSVPSILVIYKIIGFKKTFVFCALTVILSSIVGWLFGYFF